MTLQVITHGKTSHSAIKQPVESRNEFNFCSICGEWFKPVPLHYVGGSGEHGCLYDSCGVYRTFDNAVDGLAETFNLGRTRKATLKRDKYLELKPSRDGADYCEIIACNCATPWIHDEAQTEEDWQ